MSDTKTNDIWSAPIPAGYRRNHRGDLVHERNIPESDLDQDRVVERIHAFGVELSEQMSRFREHTMCDILDLRERALKRYGGKLGGKRGNITLTSFDGCRMVRLQQAEHIAIGPEIEAAQALIDECLEEWSERSNLNLRALVKAAFRPAADGRVSAHRLLAVRRVEIDDDRWRRAQDAIADAMRPKSRAEYVRLYRRATPDCEWLQVSLHLATARPPAEAAAPPAERLAMRVRGAISRALRDGVSRRDIRAAVAAARDKELKAGVASP